MRDILDWAALLCIPSIALFVLTINGEIWGGTPLLNAQSRFVALVLFSSVYFGVVFGIHYGIAWLRAKRAKSHPPTSEPNIHDQ